MIEILERIKQAANASSDAELARKIEISQQSIAKARTTKSVPFLWLPKVSTLFSVSLDWLYYGTGSMRPSDATLPPEQPAKIVQDAPIEQALQHPSCLRCAKLEEKLTLVEEERQRISTAFVESMQKNLALSEENGQLRLENLKTNQMLDTTKAMCKEYAAKLEAAEPSLFAKPQSIQSSEARNTE